MRVLLPVAFGLSAAAASAPAAGPVPGAGFEVESHAVEIRPNLAAATLSGTETIVVRSTTEGLDRLAFTPNALAIGGATADGRAVEIVHDKEALAFTLPRPLGKGDRATLRLRFAGKPARGVTASAGGLYTSYFACDWMVCLQDSPGDKADFALDLILPRGLQSASVGRALPVKALPGGFALHRWRSTRAYSPYLYAFAAGRWPGRSETMARGKLLYLNGTGAPADLGALFAKAPRIAAFLSDKAGLPLPDRRYVQLLVPGGEAQESAGFSLIGEDELTRADGSGEWIVVHEMAHGWWGNLVTCASWRDFWLNEGVATFMVAAWKEHEGGEEAYRRELDVARRRVERVRALGFDKPLAWDGTYPSLSARRAVQYSKGALFLAQLRQSLGERAFWEGLRRFTRRHAGGVVTSRDFQRAMEEASKRDLSATFTTWVYGA